MGSQQWMDTLGDERETNFQLGSYNVDTLGPIIMFEHHRIDIDNDGHSV